MARRPPRSSRATPPDQHREPVSPETVPEMTPETPVQDEDELVDEIMASILGNSPTVPETPRPDDEYRASTGQREALYSMGATEDEVDRARTQEDVEALFDKYKRRPTPTQMEFLRKRNVPNLSRVTTRTLASKIISRIKSDSPPTKSQLKCLHRLWQRDRIMGTVPADLNEFTASELIDCIKTKRETTDEQRGYLLALKVSSDDIPKYAHEAHILIHNTRLKKGLRSISRS